MNEKKTFQKELGCCGFDNVTRMMLYDDHPMCKECCVKVVKHSDGSATGYSCDCLSCFDAMDSHFSACVNTIFYFSGPIFFLVIFTMPMTLQYKSIEAPVKSGYIFDEDDGDEVGKSVDDQSFESESLKENIQA
ncbi:hypothetical protein HELRODRAFT_162489 [Helobdella robusta]|uniref:Uncharacterized protein n=1 Tax=Helobdella robusta TaxID=6412 RepID=T1ESQ8_HELRO|nr:hypothetical protein HELRODRAFT_162489 [Helobdella robusta]ESN99012.1 hypothetical protein HELRODRAFT_162489 [Helobdella robusta]